MVIIWEYLRGENAVTQCVGTDVVVDVVLPICGYLNETTRDWETTGCKMTEANATHVMCSCTHFTLFAVLAPKHNKIVPSDFLALTSSNIAVHPTGLITIVVVLCVFALVFVAAALRDRTEATNYEQLRSAKHKKWQTFAAGKKKPTFLKQLKIAFQKRHTWLSLVFRRAGTSFQSVDRTFVGLLSVFASMSMSAFYHAQDNDDVTRVSVIVISVFVCVVPSQFLILLFVRTGPLGFYEEWEQSRKPPQTNKCLVHRFPDRWRHVWRVVTLLAVIGMIVYVLTMSMNFDRQPLYFCRDESALSWVGTWLTAYAVSVLLIEPVRIVILALLAYYTAPKAVASLEVEMATAKTDKVEEEEEETAHEEGRQTN